MTSLSRESVLQRLDSVIEPRKSFRLFERNTKPYQGKLDGSHFDISHIIGYRNSFLPLIKGDVQSEFGKCSISITVHLHILVIVFAFVWCGFVGMFFLSALATLVVPQAQTEPTRSCFLIDSGGNARFFLRNVSGSVQGRVDQVEEVFSRIV